MTLDKDPYEMGNMKKFLQRNSNDMVDLKRENGDNQGNNRGQVRPRIQMIYPFQIDRGWSLLYMGTIRSLWLGYLLLLTAL